MNISPESIPKSVIDFASIADITGSDTLAMDLIDTFHKNVSTVFDIDYWFIFGSKLLKLTQHFFKNY